MSFITQVTISIVLYFIIRVSLTRSNSLNIAASVSSVSYIAMYLGTYKVISLIPTLHFLITGLSLIILFIAYYEILILERNVRKIKMGEFNNAESYSIEKNYKLVSKILGIGLVFLAFALISGFAIQSVFTTNLAIKTSFTLVALLIYLITLIGIKFFNFPIKYAIRGLFISMWAVLFAYIANSYLIYNLLMQEEYSIYFLFGVLFGLLILSGFFSGSETGMMAANKIKLKNLSKKPHRGAKRALKLLHKPDLLLSTILIGNNFANILASAIVTIIMINYFGGNVLLGSVLLTLVILIFSEITPKTMAAIKPESFAIKSSLLLKVLLFVFKPLISITNLLSSGVLKLFKLNAKDANDNDNLNTQELKTLLDESGDLIPKQYRGMLSSILGMEELVVEDIMTPTSEIIGLDLNDSYESNKKIIESTEYTRLPVFKDEIDNEIGTLHLKDSHAFLDELEINNNVDNILRTTYFVSQSTALMKQLREFQLNGKSMALVVDEYGEIQGLITIEDIFKEIAGKFGSDRVELEKEFTILKDGSVITDGNSKIRDLNNFLDWSIPEENSKTINGLITEYLDLIPQSNLCVQIDNYKFEVIRIDDNSIDRIKIIKDKI